jgi:hypothetical protein
VMDCAAEPVPPTGPGHAAAQPAAGVGGNAAAQRTSVHRRIVKKRVAKRQRRQTGRSAR